MLNVSVLNTIYTNCNPAHPDWCDSLFSIHFNIVTEPNCLYIFNIVNK